LTQNVSSIIHHYHQYHQYHHYHHYHRYHHYHLKTYIQKNGDHRYQKKKSPQLLQKIRDVGDYRIVVKLHQFIMQTDLRVMKPLPVGRTGGKGETDLRVMKPLPVGRNGGKGEDF
jgi:hypothetical protein